MLNFPGFKANVAGDIEGAYSLEMKQNPKSPLFGKI
jgi:hypothetical protein